ncbi:MAG: hypothetical protein CMB09_00570 [Euryarchaeota archaeon]|nr:hypothetical protein [Euryarchaeota archaeon]
MSPTGYPDYPTSLYKAPAFPIFKPPLGETNQLIGKSTRKYQWLALTYLLRPPTWFSWGMWLNERFY